MFDIHLSAAEATAATDYIAGLPYGKWLVGISRERLDPNANLLENVFRHELGIDTTLLNEDHSKIAFVARKGDNSAGKASVGLREGGPVSVVMDLTYRKDGKQENWDHLVTTIWCYIHVNC